MNPKYKPSLEALHIVGRLLFSPTINPHENTKSTNFRLEICLCRPWDSQVLNIANVSCTCYGLGGFAWPIGPNWSHPPPTQRENLYLLKLVDLICSSGLAVELTHQPSERMVIELMMSSRKVSREGSK